MNRWWLHFLRFARPYRGRFAAVLMFLFLGVLLNILAPWPLKLIVDYVITDQPLPDAVFWLTAMPGGGSSSALLAWLALGTLMIFVSRQVVAILKAYIQTGAASRMKFDLGVEIFAHLQRLSLQYHGTKPAGDLVRRVITDTDCVRHLFVLIILPTIVSVVTIITMFIVMWHLDRTLALLALVAVGPLPALMKWLAPRMTERTYEQHQAEGELMAVAEQTISALPVVQAFGREAHEDERFRNVSTRAIRAYLRTIVSQLQYKIGVSTATALGTAAVMALGGVHVLNGSLTIGSLLVFLSYLASLYTPIETVAYLSTSYADAAGRARRVLEVLNTEQAVKEAPGARGLPAPTGNLGLAVRLEQVSFGYEPSRPVLEDVTLEAQPGETIALVGATGAGKSTLVSLIPRFFDPWSGRVLISGYDVRGLTLDSLRSKIALVLQDPFLLPLTIAENIAYGRPDAHLREIEDAAIAANADEFIQRLPDGYNTVIGERGATLSGGQRQRLAIARALLKNAPILILDEPTSALDAETEMLFLQALDRLMADRTTFIIAHRMSTIRNADRVVTLRDRRIIESRANAPSVNDDHGSDQLPAVHV